MLDEGEEALRGRCPTCTQLVSVAAGSRARTVACPNCQHPALGAVFIELETPRAVLEAADEPRTLLRHDGPRPARPSSHAADDARTHLLLDAVPLEERSSIDVSASARGHQPSRLGDDARTHLLLDAAALEEPDEDEADPHEVVTAVSQTAARARPSTSSARAAAAAPGSSAAAGERRSALDSEEARTRLMLGPLSLPRDSAAHRSSVTELSSGAGRHVLRLGAWLDERVRGRWGTPLALAALAAGVLAPTLDGLLGDPDATCSVLVSHLSFVGTCAFALAWASAARNDLGHWDSAAARERVRTAVTLFVEDARELGALPAALKLLRAGQALIFTGLLGVAWATLLTLIGLLATVSSPHAGLRLLNGLLLLAGVLLARASSFVPRGVSARAALDEARSAARALPPLIDVSEALPASFLGENTQLHRVFIALSQWRAREWPSAAAYTAALEGHLRRYWPGCKIERGRWLGRARHDGVADLVIDDSVLVLVQRGFDEVSAERALARLRHVAQRWTDKPIVLTVFDAPRAAVFESAATEPLLQLHQRALVSTARMPTPRW